MAELPMPKDYEGSVCEIKTMENELIAIGKIKEISQKYIKINNEKKELQIVDYGTSIKVNVFNGKNGFRVLVGNVYTSTKSDMSVDNVINLVDKERRNFFRVDMEISAKVVFKKTAMDMYPTEADVTIMDMSLSGLSFKTPYTFSENHTLSIELNLNKNKNSCFQCRILRIIGFENGEYQYGCEFVYSKSEDADLLCSFLFKKQREFLNNRNSL